MLLTTFGTFWAVEGLGVFADDRASLEWPAGDLSIVVVLLTWLVVSQLMIRALSVPASAVAR